MSLKLEVCSFPINCEVQIQISNGQRFWKHRSVVPVSIVYLIISPTLFILQCLSSTTAFGLACSYFARYEEQGTGIQWNNLYSSPIEGDGFSLGYALSMMMVDAVLYYVLTWYLEAVMPGKVFLVILIIPT